jgi:quinol-cytochrome oxidoreductase complex cytochrome b subunit/coenzyme F420-reducing hydrogenase delta subunit/ferredoxin
MQAGLRRVETAFNAAFGPECNPWYQLGALAFFCFWLATVTGIYLFIFFDTSILGAYRSVARISEVQWYLGGVMRSVHRYASGAMVITVSLHLLREWTLGRFRDVRWFSWVSGVPLLWLLFAAGIGGYWLVWDRLAQYVAVATSEWIGWLPFFGDALARNFLTNAALSDRFFSLLVYLHIAIPLFLLLGMFVHIKRIKLARSTPARGLMAGTLTGFIVLALVRPASSMAPADLSYTVAQVDLDWLFLNSYPLLDALGPGALWGLLLGVTAVLVAMPWLAPTKAKQKALPAVVDPANCNGCSWCFQDCPYEAITMIPHSYKPDLRQAMVDPDLCTACGICEGSCPSATPFRNVEELISGIEMPGYPLETLRRETARVLETATDAVLFVFGCDRALDARAVAPPDVRVVSLPCIGMLPPSFADWVARQPHVAGVLVTGCHPADCYYRKGSEWTQQRFTGQRMPHLRTAAGKSKVRICWAGPHDQAIFLADVEAFRAALRPEAA